MSRMLFLAFGLLLAALSGAHAATPAPPHYRCGPSGEWLAVPEQGVLLQRGAAPCWVRIAVPARPDLALSFAGKRVAVALYDGNGVLLAQADRYGSPVNAVLTLDHLVFPMQGSGGTVVARLALDPYSGYDQAIAIDAVALSDTLARESRQRAFQVAAFAVLLVITFVAMLFAFAMRSVNYGLFSLYVLSVAAIVAFRLYLPHQLGRSPQLAWIWFCAMYPLANALGLLVMVRLGHFHRHSPLAARVLLGMAAAFLLLAPFWYVAAGPTDQVNSVLHVACLPVLYLACWRGWRRGDTVCLLILVSSLPIVVVWLPLFIADLGGAVLLPGLAANAEWLGLASDILLPLMFLGLLAQRTLAVREQASYLELNDTVTGLPNRADLQRLESAALSARHDLVVLVPNVKRFRVINEAMGTRIGDRLLAEIGRRLRQIGALHVVRLHADQFCVVTTEAQCDAVRARLAAQFSLPATVNGQVIDLNLAVGAARESELALPPGGSPRSPLIRLVRNAEIALDVARAHCLDWVEYDTELESGRQSDLGLLSELGRAIEREEFRLYLQPKVRLYDGAVVSAEALVRWQHPARGLITPEHFVPFAEKTGCIRMITQWVLTEVMALAAQLRASGKPVQIAVNLSARDLDDTGLLALLTGLLQRFGTDPSDIRLELTEHSAMADPTVTMQVMGSLRKAGFSLSIDDFGTGYSSLSYLQKMPVAELKIDRAFIHRVRPGLDGFILLQSIVELGHRLGLSVVAEGVETIDEWEMLRALRCDYIQGYFASPALTVAAFARWRDANEVFIAGKNRRQEESA